MNNRELTKAEKRGIKKIALTACAYYDAHYKECALLDGGCYMTCVGYTNSGLCKYFEKAVLPLYPKMEVLFKGYGKSGLKKCKQCGKSFLPKTRKAYCSSSCEEKGRREDTARRVRKFRQKKKTKCNEFGY